LRPALALVAALALFGAAAPGAYAHGAFIGSDPEPGARVQTSPGRIVLRFTEPLNERLSDAELVSAADGKPVAARVVKAGSRLALLPRRALERGAYRVTWRSVSTEDGHPLEGTFGFGVRVAAPGGEGATEAGPLARGGWVRAPARFALHVALLLFAGTLLAGAFLGSRWLTPGEGAETRAVRGRAGALLAELGLLAAAVAAAVALIDACTAAGRVSAAALGDYLLSGTAGLARIGLVVLTGLAALCARRRPRVAALLGAGALGCLVASGHANSAESRTVALLADAAHLLGGAIWLGGAAAIGLVWGPSLRRSEGARRVVAREVLPPFSRLALVAFSVVVVAGSINAIVELGRVSDLWRTTYGAVLLAKILLVAAIGAIAYVHAVRLRPQLGAGDARVERRHWSLLRAEGLLALGVVGAAGLLAVFPLPPRQLDAATAQRSPLPACDPCPLPAPGPGVLAVAGQGGSRVVAATVARRTVTLAGEIRLLDFRGRPAGGPVRVNGLPARRIAPGAYRYVVDAAPELRVTTAERGRAHETVLPAGVQPGGEAAARALLARAEATMRGLKSVEEEETVTSGPGTRAVTTYRLQAPDRLAYTTDLGVETREIGPRQYRRRRGEPWTVAPLPGGVPFTTRSFFRWTPYARSIALLNPSRGAGGRRLAEVAFADTATPVWVRLTIDLATARVLRERLVARARFVDHRFLRFNGPVRIEPPPDAIDASGP